MIELLRHWLIVVHVAVGLAGLALFWVPLFARKGGALHVRSGRWFALCAYIVASSGLVASVWGLVDPVGYLGMTDGGTSESVPRPGSVENLRFILSITGFLALGVIAGVHLGVSVMRAGSRHERLRSSIAPWMLASVGAWSLGLLLFGAAMLIGGFGGWIDAPPGVIGRYWINTILGGIGIMGTIGDFRYVFGATPPRAARLTMHVQCMVGSGAGFYAAFFLFGATRLVPLPGIAGLLLALVPLVAASIGVQLWRRSIEVGR